MLVKTKVKYIQSLGQKKFRQEEKLFIAEGPKLVNELAAEKNVVIQEIYAVKGWIEENKQALMHLPLHEITTAELKKISQLSTPNEVLAIVKQFDHSGKIILDNKVTLGLQTIQDPGNLGTIIRIADWYGIEQIICSIDTADIYNSKVVQSTMGSITRIKIVYTEIEQLLSENKSIPVYAATLDGSDVTKMNKINEGVILIGNESKGISPALQQFAKTKITIPRRGKAESLNAAVATGIILSHLV